MVSKRRIRSREYFNDSGFRPTSSNRIHNDEVAEPEGEQHNDGADEGDERVDGRKRGQQIRGGGVGGSDGRHVGSWFVEEFAAERP